MSMHIHVYTHSWILESNDFVRRYGIGRAIVGHDAPHHPACIRILSFVWVCLFVADLCMQYVFVFIHK